MKPTSGDVVYVHHRVIDEDGKEIESSFDYEPFRFTVDSFRVLKGMNEIVKDMESGERRTVVIPAVMAHGEYDPAKRRPFRKTTFFKGLKIGQIVTFQGELGEPYEARVVDEDEDSYIIDMNHPLAGKDLTLEIELVEIGDHEGIKPFI